MSEHLSLAVARLARGRGHHRQCQRHLCQQDIVRRVGIRQRRAGGRHGDLRRDAAGGQSRLWAALALTHRHERAHACCFDTGTEGAIFIRNCRNLGLDLGEVEEIAITHGHWDHMGALPAAIDAIVGAPWPRLGDGARQSRHVQRARRAAEERRCLSRRQGADAGPDGGARRQGRQRRQRTAAARRAFLLQRRDPARQPRSRPAGRTISAGATTRRNGGPIPT